MPRPRQALGRPGTPVIPAGWEAAHAAVVAKTFTAVVEVYPPNPGTPTLAPDLSYTPALDVAPLYSAGDDSEPNARIQIRSTEASRGRFGEQEKATTEYLVVIGRDAPEIPLRALVKVTASSDPTLGGDRRLIVTEIQRGSLRWERDLICVDDMTTPATTP